MPIVDHASKAYPPEVIDDFKAKGWWRDKLLIDYLDDNVRDRPDATAVVDEQSRVTWVELRDTSSAIATRLLELGLTSSDFVAVQLPNIVEFVEMYFGVQRAGLKALTLMSIYREKDVEFMLRKTGARVFVVPGTHRGHDYVEMADRLLDAVETLEHVIVVGRSVPGMHSYEEFTTATVDANALAARRPDPDSLARVNFTSGTTGRPKGVSHTYNTSMVPPRMTAEALGLGPTTPIWMPSPIAHITGLAFGVYESVMCGAPLVLQDRWDPGVALELIERERVVFTVSATPFIQGLLDHPDCPDRDLSTFRYFVSGGAPIPAALVERLRDETGTLLLRVFGQSEAPLHTLTFPDDPWEKLLTTDGRPLDGCKVRIVDLERTRELPRGEVGEYATWGPHVFLGYYDDPELTAEAKDAEGWYYSGDLCRMDEDGYIGYVDRIKDIINRGGVKISSLEVEQLVASHDAVQRCSIVAMPDEALGERACAFVVLRQGANLTLPDVQAHLDAMRVTKQKWPERLEVVDELPLTMTGKVQKRKLLEQLATDGDGS